MKIEITQRCRVHGVDFLPGSIVETDKGTALDRIGMGKAKKYVAPPPPDAGTEDEAGDTSLGGEEPRKKKKKKEDG